MVFVASDLLLLWHHAPKHRAICAVPHRNVRYVHNLSRECSVMPRNKYVYVRMYIVSVNVFALLILPLAAFKEV